MVFQMLMMLFHVFAKKPAPVGRMSSIEQPRHI